MPIEPDGLLRYIIGRIVMIAAIRVPNRENVVITGRGFAVRRRLRIDGHRCCIQPLNQSAHERTVMCACAPTSTEPEYAGCHGMFAVTTALCETRLASRGTVTHQRASSRYEPYTCCGSSFQANRITSSR